MCHGCVSRESGSHSAAEPPLSRLTQPWHIQTIQSLRQRVSQLVSLVGRFGVRRGSPLCHSVFRRDGAREKRKMPKRRSSPHSKSPNKRDDLIRTFLALVGRGA